MKTGEIYLLSIICRTHVKLSEQMKQKDDAKENSESQPGQAT